MDSTNCVSNGNLDAIKCLLKEGKVSVQELNESVQTIIQCELKKPSEKIDMDKVYALSDLSWMLCGSPKFETSAQKYKVEALAKLKKHDRFRHWKKRSMAAMGLAASLIVLAIIGNGILYRHWLSGDSSEDDQQYLVGGNVVDPGLIAKGSAEIDATDRDLRTQDFQAVIDFLGYAPDVPQWLPEGWHVREYLASSHSRYQWIMVNYSASHSEDMLVYQIQRYTDADEAQFSFEQNQTGEKVETDGLSIYVTLNIEKTTGVWIIDSTTYNIAGPIDTNELLKIQRSIGGKNANESL